MGTAAIMLPILLLLVPLLHYGLGRCCPNFRRWCRRYAADFTAVGVAFYTSARVNAARFSAVGVGVTLPKFFSGIWRGRGRLRS